LHTSRSSLTDNSLIEAFMIPPDECHAWNKSVTQNQAEFHA